MKNGRAGGSCLCDVTWRLREKTEKAPNKKNSNVAAVTREMSKFKITEVSERTNTVN